MSSKELPPAIAAIVVVLATACSAGTTTKTVAAPKAVITPADGTGTARPDKGVSVTAADGVLDRVSVLSDGRGVDGALSADKKTWHTTWTLKPGAAYTVTAVERSAAGKTTTSTSRFTTAKASSRIAISDVTPQSGETVGVGMPIMVTFDRTVYNRAWVERALEIRSTKPVEGAWHWMSGQQVIFRPKTYWPAYTDVALVAHMSGVRAAVDTYGTTDSTRSFRIGASHITRVNLKSDKEKVYVDGKLAKTIPVSGGMGGSDSHGNDFRTTSGVHLAMGNYPKLWFTSPNIKKGQSGYYHELVYDDVQISNSGEYLHRSPGDYGCLGNRNCSHGCVRQTPAGAKWFYDLSKRGDVIDVSGTSRPLELNNGWGYWQMPWTRWVLGSALKRPTTTVQVANPAPAQNLPAPGHGQTNPTPGHD
jgi:lipoprotein-anchoring transpeptidase ErfK/SrfK